MEKSRKAADPNHDVPRIIPPNMRYVVTVLDWDDPFSAPETLNYEFRSFEEALHATHNPKYYFADAKITVEPAR